ncbi:hypothetical protein Godav_029033, partial [Gossypium davidsonii]|nr:hypothetical protein [Gossypium davidsonii]
GDVEGVKVNEEGDDEGVESDGEGDLEKVESRSTGEDNDSEVATDEYAGDFATSGGVDNVVDEYAGYFATSDGLDNVAAARSGVEEDGNETEVWDSDEHGSLVGSDEDEKNEDGKKRRSKFLLYNDKLKLSLGMLIKDGKQFKSAI